MPPFAPLGSEPRGFLRALFAPAAIPSTRIIASLRSFSAFDSLG